MKKSKYSGVQIMGISNYGEGGVPITELCREHGMSNASFYKWLHNLGTLRCRLIGRIHPISATFRQNRLYANWKI